MLCFLVSCCPPIGRKNTNNSERVEIRAIYRDKKNRNAFRKTRPLRYPQETPRASPHGRHSIAAPYVPGAPDAACKAVRSGLCLGSLGPPGRKQETEPSEALYPDGPKKEKVESPDRITNPLARRQRPSSTSAAEVPQAAPPLSGQRHPIFNLLRVPPKPPGYPATPIPKQLRPRSTTSMSPLIQADAAVETTRASILGKVEPATGWWFPATNRLQIKDRARAISI